MPPRPITATTLFYGDNLDILREYIAELLRGAEVKMPPAHGTFKQAQRVQQVGAEQQGFEL